ncbi:MAG: sigma 54-interacting transcriptional regulator [Polyangiaceae bacterium]|nr:sigma 54-interacting transcriptional regulator [Polyangiaceae bacterium]MCB9605712.1 sigma 54-interacting transcriptional regulator [Polyangiaceae bacterium]
MQLALQEAAGAVIVLDERLKIIERTALAEELVGSELPLGTLASKVLCGEAGERPIAEALAEGRATTGRLPRLDPDGGARMLRVRAIPLSDPPQGWMLFLETESSSTLAEGQVNFHGILTCDARMKALLADLVKVAHADSSVIVRGETGSGKELVAHAVHLESERANGPFRAINCAALPAQLLESELFGHVRGAFTGAIRDNEGHFRLAHKGTLFLDEVAELPLDLQAKLLRVLQERSVLPIGGREPIPVDVRVVTATHRSLRSEVAAGRFRADLMYRLRVIPLFLPALRERPQDVGLLSQHFVTQWNQRSKRQVSHVSSGALRALESYDWPGNVRELQNAIEYAFVMGSGAVLTEAELPPEVRGDAPLAPASLNVAAEPDVDLPAEARRLVQALERAGGSRERAAQSLGISRTTLWRKLRRYGLAGDE